MQSRPYVRIDIPFIQGVFLQTKDPLLVVTYYSKPLILCSHILLLPGFYVLLCGPSQISTRTTLFSRILCSLALCFPRIMLHFPSHSYAVYLILFHSSLLRIFISIWQGIASDFSVKSL
jgi:hypothetical protein